MPGLIITNGDSAAELLRAAGRTDTILSWQDVLHEGPIIATDLDDCTAIRVPFLARRFGLAEPEVAMEFAARDALMHRHGAFDRVELWFEHDLFDQLQLIQVLAFLAAERRTQGVILVQADDFLGAQSAQTILRFAAIGRPVTEADLDVAATVWGEVAAPTPEAVAARVVRVGGSPLPFLVPALHRFLEELPSAENGLGRTEQTIVDLLAENEGADGRSLFGDAIRREEAAFMGDWSFFGLIEDLAAAEVPLIAGIVTDGGRDLDAIASASLELTMAGDDVRKGEDDHVALSGIDRWWAGTRLMGRDVWRYDRSSESLVPPGRTGA